MKKSCGTCVFCEMENSPCCEDNAPDCNAPDFQLWVSKEPQAHNNGGSTDYYDFPENVKCVQDLIEHRNMNFAQGNMCKVVCTFNTQRHDGTTYERELNKIIWFANRELKRIKENL